MCYTMSTISGHILNFTIFKSNSFVKSFSFCLSPVFWLRDARSRASLLDTTKCSHRWNRNPTRPDTTNPLAARDHKTLWRFSWAQVTLSTQWMESHGARYGSPHSRWQCLGIHSTSMSLWEVVLKECSLFHLLTSCEERCSCSKRSAPRWSGQHMDARIRRGMRT